MSDFSTTPDIVFTEKVKQAFVESEFENGTKQRRSVWGSPRREWKLVFRGRTAAEYAALLAFYELYNGGAESFTWTNPNDNTEYTVWFKEDTFESEVVGNELYEISFIFEEVK